MVVVFSCNKEDQKNPLKMVGYDFRFNSKDEEHPIKKNGGGLGCN
jgi:hypothetical protein